MFDSANAALALAIVLIVLAPMTGVLERRFLQSSPGTARKLAYYAVTIVASWALTAAAVRLYGVERLAGLVVPWAARLPFAAITGPMIGAVVAAYFLLALMPLAQSLRGPRRRRACAAAYRRHAEGFAGILPDTGIERLGFVLFSLTAGLCEEALYRGFLIRYLHEGAPALPLLPALAVSSLAFGFLHTYQGIPGMIRTGLGGLAFGLVFLLTGSLIPAIALHALVDLQIAYVLRPVPGEDGMSEGQNSAN